MQTLKSKKFKDNKNGGIFLLASPYCLMEAWNYCQNKEQVNIKFSEAYRLRVFF